METLQPECLHLYFSSTLFEFKNTGMVEAGAVYHRASLFPIRLVSIKSFGA